MTAPGPYNVTACGVEFWISIIVFEGVGSFGVRIDHGTSAMIVHGQISTWDRVRF